MNKGLFRKVTSLVLGFLLVFTGALSGVGSQGRVKAAAAYSIAYDLGNANVHNATLSFEFRDAQGNLIGDSEFVSVGTGVVEGGRTHDAKTGTLPDNVAQVYVGVQTAGQDLDSSSYIRINGVGQGISGDMTSTGQFFDITSSDSFEVSFTLKNPNAGGQNPPPGGGEGGQNPPPVNGRNVKIIFTGADENEVWDLGIIKLIGDQDQIWGFDPGNWERNDIGFAPSYSVVVESRPGCLIESCTVNGTAATVSGSVTEPVAVEIEDGDVVNEITISASIVVDPNYSNVFWGYDPEIVQGDNYVDPNTGSIEIEKITRDGVVIYSSQGNDFLDWPLDDVPNAYRYLWRDPDHQVNVSLETDGSTEDPVIFTWYAECRSGDVVTFKFIPQPGYQLKSASLNGFILAPQEEECTFNIVMGGLLHVTGAFVEASNQIDLGEGTVVSGADVEGTGGIDKGTIAASFENTAVPADSVITGAMGDQSEDFIESVGSLDINLTQIISKGGTDDYSTNSNNYWATPVSELEEAVDMSLSLPADDLEDGETYGIVRQHGNDTELLDATYNSTLGTLTFESDRFSTYTIIKLGGTPETGGDEPGEEGGEEGEGGFDVSFDMGNASVENATLTMVFMGDGDENIGNIDLTIGGDTEFAGLAYPFPPGLKRINLIVTKAGQEFDSDSYITVNGEAVAISGDIEEGQLIDVFAPYREDFVKD